MASNAAKVRANNRKAELEAARAGISERARSRRGMIKAAQAIAGRQGGVNIGGLDAVFGALQNPDVPPPAQPAPAPTEAPSAATQAGPPVPPRPAEAPPAGGAQEQAPTKTNFITGEQYLDVPVEGRSIAAGGPPAEAMPVEKAVEETSQGGPTDLLIRSLLESLNNPTEISTAQPLSRFQALAAGMLAAIDPERYQQIVSPLLEQRHTIAAEENRQRAQQYAQKLSTVAAIGNIRGLQLQEQDRVQQEAIRAMEDADLKAFAGSMGQEAEGMEMEVDGTLALGTSLLPELRAQSPEYAATIQMQMDGLRGQYQGIRDSADVLSSMMGRISPLSVQQLSGRLQGLRDTKERLVSSLETFARYDAQQKAMAARQRGSDRSARIYVERALSAGRAANRAQQALAKFEELGRPGNPVTTLGGNVAMTDDMQEWRSYIQAISGPLFHDISGAAVAPGEADRNKGWIPLFGMTDNSTIEGLNRIVEYYTGRSQDQLKTLEMTGFDTSGVLPDMQNAYDQLVQDVPNGMDLVWNEDHTKAVITVDGQQMIYEPSPAAR